MTQKKRKKKETGKLQTKLRIDIYNSYMQINYSSCKKAAI